MLQISNRVCNFPNDLTQFLSHHPILLFDVGARGGTRELARFSDYIHCFGVEPHPGSFAGLEEKKRVYARERFFPFALDDREGEGRLYLTHHPSYSSLLQPDWDMYHKHGHLMSRYAEWKQNLTVIEEVEVQCITLDKLLKQEEIIHIDFLKLDTQGTELRILQGAEGMINKGAISVIKCEFSFLPFYKGQNLFADIDLFLRQRGFCFLDALFYPEVARKKGGSSKLKGVVERPHFGVGGDALYYLAPSGKLAREQLIKMGLILAEMGYYGPAYQIFKQHTDMKEEIFRGWLRLLARATWQTRLKHWAKRWMPPALLDWLRSMRFNS